ncbi:Uncharacterized protein TCAP_05560 [Tolypocladium capitatum]|uniref:Secreted protein n=1 Tax=Tolypocladium capitatum TaxID=45235 RepID=A0A2K3QAJ8_9HYPO|nr:Uncharacterized protein TCAP_05560 [Tolypocladium capitatum]
MRSILLYILLAVVRAAPSPSHVDIVPIPGATVVPQFWDVQAFLDGPTLILNGTVQDIHKQLLEINPNYDTDFNHTAVATGDLEKRTDFTGSKVICSRAIFGHLNYGAYKDSLTYLGKHPGRPHMPPGPRACSRVSCSYNTGVYICNDTPTDKYLISWGSVVDGLQYIWAKCVAGILVDMQGGQVFHSTNWNVILRETNC